MATTKNRRVPSRFSSRRRKCEDGESISLAPPLEVLDVVPGYEALTFESVTVPPPAPYGEFSISGPTQQRIVTCTPGKSSPTLPIPQMTEAMAKDALLSHVKGQCCWGYGPARQMILRSIRDFYAYHYILHTFTEKREVRWSWIPHMGSDIDGPEEGRVPPAPWDIPALPSKPFHAEVKAFEVPHTASVKPCYRCRGAGALGCPACHGKGWSRCIACAGEGFGLGVGESRERCIICTASAHGHGRQDCTRCGAKGRIPCSICDSYGQLKCYVQLTVSWRVIVGEYVSEDDNLSSEYVRQGGGQIGLEETGIRLAALPPDILGPGESLAMASTRLITEHLEYSTDTLLLAQRHLVRMVPVSLVDYHWKRHQGKFYIYGMEKRVCAPEYPQTYCCGCTIM